MARQGYALRPSLGGEPLVGVHLTVASPDLVELSASVGFQFVNLDVEHEPIADDQIAQVIRAGDAFGIPVIVRVAFDRDRILRIANAGAAGIQTPHCESTRDAEALVDCLRFAPEGSRTFYALGRSANYEMGIENATWAAAANRDIAAIVTIEDIETAGIAEEIAAVPGIDAVHIGPKDLWQSMGMPEWADVESVISQVIHGVLAQHKVVSMSPRLTSPTATSGLLQRGVGLVNVMLLDFIRTGSAALWAEIGRTAP